MTTATTVSQAMENRSLEATVHKLKLQWMMAKTDDERRQLSEQIRKLLNPQTK